MNQFLAIGILASSAIAGLGSVGPGGLACQTENQHLWGEAGLEGDAPGIGSFGIGLFWRVNAGPPPTATLSNPEEDSQTGCVVFVDANGNEVGRFPGTIPAGGSVDIPIPPGATDFRLEDCEEEEDDEKDSKLKIDEDELDLEEHPLQFATQGQQGKIRRQEGPRTYSFEMHTFAPTLGRRNVTYVLDVTASDLDDAREAMSMLRSEGLDGQWQPVVSAEVFFYSEAAVVNPMSGDVALTFADDDAFETLELRLNGTLLGTLDDATPVVTRNGWDGVRFLIPATAFVHDPTPGAHWRNDIEVRYRVRGSPTEFVYAGSSEYQTL